MKTRAAGLDAIRIVGVLAIVVGHVYGTETWVRTWLYPWHVPVFFLLSGYFWTPRRRFGAELRQRTRSLLLPYVCWILLVGGSMLIVYNAQGDGDRAGRLAEAMLTGGAHAGRPLSTFWFVSALFGAALVLRLTGQVVGWLVAIGLTVFEALAPDSARGVPLALGILGPGLIFMLVGRRLRAAEPSLRARPWLGVLCAATGFALFGTGVVDTIDLKAANLGTPVASLAVSALLCVGLVLIGSSLDFTEDAGYAVSLLALPALVVVLTHPLIAQLMTDDDQSLLCVFDATVLPWVIGLFLLHTPLALPLVGSPRRRRVRQPRPAVVATAAAEPKPVVEPKPAVEPVETVAPPRRRFRQAQRSLAKDRPPRRQRTQPPVAESKPVVEPVETPAAQVVEPVETPAAKVVEPVETPTRFRQAQPTVATADEPEPVVVPVETPAAKIAEPVEAREPAATLRSRLRRAERPVAAALKRVPLPLPTEAPTETAPATPTTAAAKAAKAPKPAKPLKTPIRFRQAQPPVATVDEHPPVVEPTSTEAAEPESVVEPVETPAAKAVEPAETPSRRPAQPTRAAAYRRLPRRPRKRVQPEPTAAPPAPISPWHAAAAAPPPPPPPSVPSSGPASGAPSPWHAAGHAAAATGLDKLDHRSAPDHQAEPDHHTEPDQRSVHGEQSAPDRPKAPPPPPGLDKLDHRVELDHQEAPDQEAPAELELLLEPDPVTEPEPTLEPVPAGASAKAAEKRPLETEFERLLGDDPTGLSTVWK